MRKGLPLRKFLWPVLLFSAGRQDLELTGSSNRELLQPPLPLTGVRARSHRKGRTPIGEAVFYPRFLARTLYLSQSRMDFPEEPLTWMALVLKLRQDAHPCGPGHTPPIFSQLLGLLPEYLLTFPWDLFPGVEPSGGRTPAKASTPASN